MDGASTILIESLSPNGNVQAIAEQYGNCCYFYLNAAPETGLPMRSCWVRNLRPAPDDLDVERMKAGQAPMLPAGACAHPLGAPRLRGDDLEVVWLEEGDAAALLERDAILAIVPAWAGSEGFAGYARDCTKEHALCWPLGTPETNVLFDRVHQARRWWRSWSGGAPWKALQGGTIEALERTLGPHRSYYAIDGGNWPPKAMLRFEAGGATALVTCGVAIRPQPTVEMAAPDPKPLRRIELGIAVDEATFSSAGNEIMGYLSGQTNLPWNRHTWLGEGHTIPCDALSRARQDSAFTAVLLVRRPTGAPVIELPDFRGDPVSLLWAVPITEPERALAMDSGSAALLERLDRAGAGWMHRSERVSVA